MRRKSMRGARPKHRYNGIQMASKWEVEVAEILDACRKEWNYEGYSFGIRTPIRGQKCLHCGEPLEKQSYYTPDFLICGTSMVIECKGGSFKATDQARYKRFVKQYADVQFIMVFRSDVRLRNLKGRPRVSEWGKQHGITVIIGTEALWRYLR